MPLFPAFIDITDQAILLVGGGEVAARKIEKLLTFRPQIHLVAKQVNNEVQNLIRDNNNIHFEQRPFKLKDLKGKKLVIAAINDIDLQSEIYKECEQNGQLCNCVDSPDWCSFIFPALVHRGDLTIGINTTAKAPYFSGKMRQHLENVLPQNLGDMLEKAFQFRLKLPDRKASAQKIKNYIDQLFLDNF